MRRTHTIARLLLAALVPLLTPHINPLTAWAHPPTCAQAVYTNSDANGTYQSGIGHTHRYQGARFTPTTTFRACTIHAQMTKIEGDVSAKKFVMRIWDFSGTALGNQLAYSNVVYGNNTWSHTEVEFTIDFRFVAGTTYAVTIDMGEVDPSNYAGWNLGYALPEQTVCAYDATTRAQAACDANYSVLMRIVGNTSASSACSDRIVNTTYQDSLAPVHTTTDNYYRGGIYTFAKAAGICTVTVYLEAQDGNYTRSGYYLRLAAVASDNMTTTLATSQDVYMGGNWTRHGDDNWTETRKTFHFYEPIHVPAGELAVAVFDNSSTAHPLHHHAWARGPAQTGVKSCAWNTTKGGTCTTDGAPMIEIGYVEAPYLTATPHCWSSHVGAPPYTWSCPNYPHMGWLQIPEWEPYGLDWCEMPDNSTVACELPSGLPAGHGKLKARFVPPDGNESRSGAWGLLRYKIVKDGEGEVSSVVNHPSGDTTATITGTYQ